MATYEDVFAALDDAGVRFVVVGGIAVVLHGHVRATVDADLVIDLESEAARNAMEALSDLGLSPRLPVAASEFADESVRRTWIETKGMSVFTMLDPADPTFELDLFVKSPRPFTELFGEAKVVEVAGRPIRIASIDHLIAMKRVAGRPKDLLDIDDLERLRDE